MIVNGFRALQSWLFPPTCVLCGDPGHGDRDLCEPCRADLPYNRYACITCARPLADTLSVELICGECLRDPPPFLLSTAPFVYQPPLTHLLPSLKFHGKLAHARLLGELMADFLLDQGVAAPDLIVPVPLHRTRLRERGYNQALELARPIARRLGVALDHRVCVRTRATTPQTQLGGSRRRSNLKGAFRARATLAGRHVTVLDDVVTTATTVREVARVLKQAGAERIDVWACARV